MAEDDIDFKDAAAVDGTDDDDGGGHSFDNDDRGNGVDNAGNDDVAEEPTLSLALEAFNCSISLTFALLLLRSCVLTILIILYYVTFLYCSFKCGNS